MHFSSGWASVMPLCESEDFFLSSTSLNPFPHSVTQKMGYPTRKSYIERAIDYLFDIFALRPFLVSIYLP